MRISIGRNWLCNPIALLPLLLISYHTWYQERHCRNFQIELWFLFWNIWINFSGKEFIDEN